MTEVGATMKKTAIITTVFTLFLCSFLRMPVFADQEMKSPLISSESAILIDAQSGQVLFNKYSNSKMYPASTTKIATAIYAIETGNLEDRVTISSNARGTMGSSVYLDEGEELSLEQLVEGLLVNSGNDAAVAIAEHLDGSVERFSKNINAYLKDRIGVLNTHFMNPHGLYDPEHTTTASDLAKITQYAIKNDTFREIFGMKELKWEGQSWSTTIYTHHKLMREAPYDGVTGGKTGYIDEARFTLVTTAKRENTSLIAVVLKGSKEGIYEDTVKLFDYGFEHFKSVKIPKGKEFVNEQKETFVTEEDLYYTQLLEEPTKPELLNNGSLVIDQPLDSLDISFSLPKKEMEKVEINVQKVAKQTDVKEKEAGPLSEFFLVVVIVEILMVSLLFFFRRFMKRVRTGKEA